MPNDPNSNFPSPQFDNQPQDIKLTDEVAPVISAPQTPYVGGQAAPPVMEPPTYSQAPVYSPPAPPPPPPAQVYAPIPASAPTSSGGHFPFVTILLLLISIGAIAATYFFYQQSQSLNLQLSEITRTLDQQKIKENQITPTPTLEITPTPYSTLSAQPTDQMIPTPPTSFNSNPGIVFGNISSILSQATSQFPGSELILIKVTGVENPSLTLIKYWFRKSVGSNTYFYIQKEAGKDAVIVDLGGKVTPDNNIPSLNSQATAGKLGIDLNEAVSLAVSVCPTTFDCANSTITAQFIKTKNTLWQISYKSLDNKSFVVQIDSLTGKVFFKSL